MAKGEVYIDGIDDIINDFDRIAGDINIESKAALESELTKIESQMKSNARSAFDKGYTQNVMVNSISHNISIKDDFITASVGVYDMSNKTGSSDRLISGRHISEPLIAYFFETGVRPHSTSLGARLAHPTRGKEKGQTGKLHGGLTPIPFLSSAFDTMSANIIVEIANRLNKSIDKK